MDYLESEIIRNLEVSREEYRTKARASRKSSLDPVDWRIFSPTPLARLLKKESNQIIQSKMKELEPLVAESLSPKEEAFLRLLVGRNWARDINLPSLEFLEDVSEYAEYKVPEVKERLEIIQNYLRDMKNVRNQALHLISYPYSLMTEKETVKEYQGVLENGHSFPKGFFENDNRRKAKIVTKYMYESIIGITPQEVMARARKKDFVSYALGYMLKSQFDDSPQKAIKNAYTSQNYQIEKGMKKENNPKQPESNLGGLTQLVDSIDTLFEE